jgi:hypothetical protein
LLELSNHLSQTTDQDPGCSGTRPHTKINQAAEFQKPAHDWHSLSGLPPTVYELQAGDRSSRSASPLDSHDSSYFAAIDFINPFRGIVPALEITTQSRIVSPWTVFAIRP